MAARGECDLAARPDGDETWVSSVAWPVVRLNPKTVREKNCECSFQSAHPDHELAPKAHRCCSCVFHESIRTGDQLAPEYALFVEQWESQKIASACHIPTGPCEEPLFLKQALGTCLIEKHILRESRAR